MCKENNNNIIYSAVFLPELPSSAILESIPERNQRNQRCLCSVDSACMLNVNNAHYVRYFEELLNKLLLLLFSLHTKCILVAS